MPEVIIKKIYPHIFDADKLTAIQSNLLFVVPARMIGTPSAINENNSSGILDYPPNLLKTLFPAIHL